jgi:DNA repair protein RecO (recombination protein O)
MPPAAATPALLLRSVAYGESDLVATLLTRDLGKLSCLAKGARSSRRRFSASLQPFCVMELMVRPRSGGLSFLERAEPLRFFGGILADLDRMTEAWRLLELADQLEGPGAIHPEFFGVLEEGLASLEGGGSPGEAAIRAEARMLELSGWAPRLDECVSCRKPWPFPSARLSLSEGGLLCGACRTEGAAIGLPEGAGHALRAAFHGGNGPLAQARGPLRRFVEYQLGKVMRTEDFERKLKGGRP